VFSIGDLLLIVGLALVVFTVTRTDPASDVPYLQPLKAH
jgi:hypothetical protein